MKAKKYCNNGIASELLGIVSNADTINQTIASIMVITYPARSPKKIKIKILLSITGLITQIKDMHPAV